LTGRSPHCTAVRDVLEAKELYENAEAMITHCQSQSLMLVDCYITLALMRGYNMALFVIDMYNMYMYNRETAEGQLQREHRANDMQHGLNVRLANSDTGKSG